jgi:Fe-S-cluster containining protein
LQPGNGRAFEAHLRHAATLLRDNDGGSPSARVVDYVTGLLERSIPDEARGQLACGSGCSFCCYQPVGINAPEAFFLASEVRRDRAAAAAVMAAAAGLSGATARHGAARWPRCPLLGASGNCSFYAVRPLSCHGYVSISAEDCRSNHDHPGRAEIGEPFIYRDVRDMCRMIMHAGLRLNALSDTNYELSAAVSRALKTPDAEKRWREGEDIFAGLGAIPLTANGEKQVAYVTAKIAPTL